MQKFKPDDVCVIHSKTSHANGSIVRVLYYTKGNRDDIVKVESCDKSTTFNITENALELANKYDLIRNMSDTQLQLLLQSAKEKDLTEADITQIHQDTDELLQSIGYDNEGKPLFVGDTCEFLLKLSRPTNEYDRQGKRIYSTDICRLSGTIVYDHDSYAYAFKTCDDYCPIILMYCAEYGSIKKKESEK